MSGQEVIGVIGAALGVGIALAVLILRVTRRLDAGRRAADRRAMQQSMDTFRNEMLRLAGRQARLEGAADD